MSNRKDIPGTNATLRSAALLAAVLFSACSGGDSAKKPSANASRHSAKDAGAHGRTAAKGDAGTQGASNDAAAVGVRTDASTNSDGGYVRPDPVDLAPLVPVDLATATAALPKDDKGRPVLVDNGEAQLVIDQTTKLGPVNALARCLRLLTECEDARNPTDVCWVSIAKCASDTPWDEASSCCPNACFAGYEAQRKQGAAPVVATYTLLFQVPSCIPGLDRARGEVP